MPSFTADEKKLIKYAKKRYVQLRKLWRSKGLHDNYYACILSNSGKIYEGVPFVTELGSSHVCCERVAIANMYTNETEKAKLKVVLVIGPIGKGGLLTPCGLCRHVINKFSDKKAIVLCAGEYFTHIQNIDFLFKKIKKYTIKKLYPYPYNEGSWD